MEIQDRYRKWRLQKQSKPQIFSER